MTALYGVAYTERALRFLEKLSPAKIRGQIRRRIDALAKDPTPSGSKRVQGVTDDGNPVHRVRQGKIRILYSVRGNPSQIIVFDIDFRKDVYR